jgi:4-amino-4-deoxy-L-arabinose transferase-like glycosyltransferase
MAPPADSHSAGSRVSAPSHAELRALAAIVAVALVLRIWNLLELRTHDPFFADPSVDELTYHTWARSIAAGNGFGNRVFLNAPAYPGFLALLYQVFGPSLLAAKAVQSSLAAFDCVLVWALGRRLFGPAVALGAAGILALYERAIFYPATLLMESVQGTLVLALLLVTTRALERDGPLHWAAAGACTGLAALARPNALLFWAALIAWDALRPGVAARRRVLAAVAFTGGTLALVLPATWHNARVSGDFVLVSSGGGMNLYIGNNSDAQGEFNVPRVVPRALADDPQEQRAVFAALAEQASGRALAPSEISAFWARRALDFVRDQPAVWARLMWRKFLLSFNAYEPYNVRSLTLAREASSVLRLPLLGFGVVAPFAVLGLVATRRSWQRFVPLYAWLATVWITLWVFFVLERYRVGALPVIALFAAAGVAHIVCVLRARRVRSLLGVAVMLAALFIGMHWPIAEENLGIAYYNLGNRFRVRGQAERAIEAYQEAMRRSPDYLSAYNNLALAYEDAGRRDEARAAWNSLLAVAQRQGSPRHVERAERHLRELGAEPAPAR